MSNDVLHWGQDRRPSFYEGDAEIGLLLELPGNKVWAIESKRSSAPTVSRGFHLPCDDVVATRRIVVSSANAKFPMTGGIEPVPLLVLMQELLALRGVGALS
ncbi:hypothetical protein [Polaromonas sp.]|uniref:hypothetical protein n=1 Tax=Polaromonas sp. TaxID=1869339 RepID=UPI0035680A9F